MPRIVSCRVRALAVLTCCAIGIAACGGDAPTRPVAQPPPSTSLPSSPYSLPRPDPLTKQFLDLAQVAFRDSQFDRAMALSNAASAMFHGAHPQPVTITRDGVSGAYLAAASIIDPSGLASGGSSGSATHPLIQLVAWQGAAAQRLVEVTTNGTPTQWGTLPTLDGLGAYLADSAAATERAVADSANIATQALGAACSPPTTFAGIRLECNAITVLGTFDLTTQRQLRSGGPDPSAERHRLSMASQQVSGTQLRYSK